MSIKHWPTSQQPREKLLTRGAESLSDAELLALFLRTGYEGKNAITLAAETLAHFDGLANLLQCNVEQFCAIKGLGQAKYAQLQATLELASRFFECQMQQTTHFNQSQLCKQFFIAKLAQREHEQFVAILLNNQHQLLHFKVLFNGSINRSVVYPREVVKCALQHNCAAIIFAHNHPSGQLIASEEDKQITQTLIKALALVDIRVLDHIIVAHQSAISMAEQGLM